MSNPRLGELERLTDSERLLIDRRRRGENQGQAARRLRITRFNYGRLERGIGAIPKVKIGRLKSHETCLLYRRRAGWTQAQVAKELERCRWWINQMERGEAPCDELLWFWEQ